MFSSIAALTSFARAERGDSGSSSADKGATDTTSSEEAEKKKLPWHGSIVLFDQSVTTQTVGLGADYQSRDAVYEWWFAFKPRYYLYETKTNSLSLNLWMNLFLELTSSDTTTKERELVVGPTALWASYGQTLFERSGYKTSVSIGPRMTLPTDMISRHSGNVFGLGGLGGARQTIPLAGKAAPSFNSVEFGVGAIYNHAFNRTTSPEYGGLSYEGQDFDQRSIPLHVFSNRMLAHDTLNVSAIANLSITPKLTLGLSYLIGNAWAYAAPETQVCPVNSPGCVDMPSNPDAPTYRVNTWALGTVDYDVIDEMSLSLGYYNLTNQIGPDGKRRNPLWSPDARIFFTITGNLDAIYERITAKPAPAQTASTRP